MPDALISPTLILLGIVFACIGWRKVRVTLAKPDGEFRDDPLFTPKTKLHISLLRLTEMLDSITFLGMGAAIVIVGIIGLMTH
ncbi:MAG TPA: hypothetical protein VGV59_08975 [Pyrinomonadaceae bacterium]|nr:hypothetical protein [Pyrinomonadaceae bacterium]